MGIQDNCVDNINKMTQAQTDWRSLGNKQLLPYMYARMAEINLNFGQFDNALDSLTEAYELINKTNENWWLAEIHRIKGEVLLIRSPKSKREAESCFKEALDVAAYQKAKSLELRAAMSLGRLWQSQGRREEARKLLLEVYGWFTEGFDTPDLKDVKALLEKLST
jgi:predicted ATPase